MKNVLVSFLGISLLMLGVSTRAFADHERGDGHHGGGHGGHGYYYGPYYYRYPYYPYRAPVYYYPVPAPDVADSGYSRDQVGAEQIVSYGEVTAVSNVTIDGPSGLAGGIVGGVTGAAIGNSIGSGSGKVVATVVGTVAGAIAGNTIEKHATARPGVELSVRTDDGRSLVVVQERGEVFRPGDRVSVLSTPDRTLSARHLAVSDETMTINIPNDRGGYTPVTLARSGSGFVGPQGEFYPEFPKVSQLKAMYGQ